MPTIGFDSKDFKRAKIDEGGKRITFYSPLGVGVKTNDLVELRKKTVEKTSELSKSFGLGKTQAIHCSNSLVRRIGHRKATPFFDQLLKGLEEFIDAIFFSYVILPPKDNPTVEVGGYRCPRVKMETMDFLRAISSSFSYITAWSYCGRHREHDCSMFIDSFSGKETTAWDDLKQYDFRVFPRGDECNVIISLADIFAYLTEKKLWDSKQWLLPQPIEEIWGSYGFNVETRFLDDKVLSKIQWYSDEPIEIEPFLAHPIVFLDLSEINMKRFIQFDLYCDLVTYAFRKEGSIQGFDINLDSKRVKDGDVYVYAGEDAHNRAKMFEDMYDIEAYSVKEIRQKIKDYSL